MGAVEFNPEVMLSHDERAQIAHTMATPGFIHINRIMRVEVDKFAIDLINADEDNDKMVLARHKMSKAAAQYYARVVSRINSEAQQFMREAGNPTEPTDPTEGLIDLGEFVNAEEPESFLEGLELNEQLLEEELHG